MCAKCNVTLPNREFLGCSRCKQLYDIPCSGRSARLFYLMSKESKKAWICQACHSKPSTPNQVVTNEPSIKVRKTDEKNVTLRRKKPKKTSSLPTTSSGPQVPVNTSNTSTISTSTQQDNLTRSNSTDTILGTDDYLQDTINFFNEDLSRSLELTNDSSLVTELKCEIDRLKIDLVSTDNELQNSILEKNELGRQIVKLTRELCTLKNICKTPQKKINSHKSRSSSSASTASPIDTRNNSSPHPDYTIKVLNMERTITKLQSELFASKQQMMNLNQIISKLEEELHRPTTAHINSFEVCKNILHPAFLKVKRGKQLNKLCILSSSTRSNLLRNLKSIDLYSDFECCHYITPNVGINLLLRDLNAKLKDYTKQDFCIIMIGEADFHTNLNYEALVQSINEKLKNITNTNIIIALPTYICGALLHNCRVDLLNDRLGRNLLKFNYASLYDTNLNLTLEQFSQSTGKIIGTGVRSILRGLADRISSLQKEDAFKSFNSEIEPNESEPIKGHSASIDSKPTSEPESTEGNSASIDIERKPAEPEPGRGRSALIDGKPEPTKPTEFNSSPFFRTTTSTYCTKI